MAENERAAGSPPWDDLGTRALPSAELLAAVSTAWGLGYGPDRAAVTDMGGTYNLNLRAQSARGDVVLRVYRPWVTAGRLAAVQAIKHALHAAGVPVVVPMARPDGVTAMAWHGRLIEVESWVSSDGGADSWERYHAAGGQLGALHAAFADLRLPVPFVGAPVSNVIDEPTFRDWMARTRRAIVRDRLDLDAMRALATCDEAERLRGLAVAHPRREPTIHLSHGDFAHDNVRFFGPAPVAILDFDFVDVRDRLTDVAYTTYWMFEHLQWDVPPAERDWWQATELIRRYGAASGAPLTADELAALPLAMATIPTTWIAEAWLMGDARHAIGLVARQMETVAWLIDHREDLARLWA